MSWCPTSHWLRVKRFGYIDAQFTRSQFLFGYYTFPGILGGPAVSFCLGPFEVELGLRKEE